MKGKRERDPEKGDGEKAGNWLWLTVDDVNAAKVKTKVWNLLKKWQIF